MRARMVRAGYTHYALTIVTEVVRLCLRRCDPRMCLFVVCSQFERLCSEPCSSNCRAPHCDSCYELESPSERTEVRVPVKGAIVLSLSRFCEGRTCEDLDFLLLKNGESCYRQSIAGTGMSVGICLWLQMLTACEWIIDFWLSFLQPSNGKHQCDAEGVC